jgi:hypothetical protein
MVSEKRLSAAILAYTRFGAPKTQGTLPARRPCLDHMLGIRCTIASAVRSINARGPSRQIRPSWPWPVWAEPPKGSLQRTRKLQYLLKVGAFPLQPAWPLEEFSA